MTRLEYPRPVTASRDVLYVRTSAILATKSFGRSTVPNWDRTDHSNATKHRKQTELEGMHDSVAVESRIVKMLNTENEMDTYERLGRIVTRG